MQFVYATGIFGIPAIKQGIPVVMKKSGGEVLFFQKHDFVRDLSGFAEHG